MTAVSSTRLAVTVVPPSDARARQALRAYYHDIAGRYYDRALTEAEVDEILDEEPDADLQPPTGWFCIATTATTATTATAATREVAEQDTVVGCVGLRYISENGERVGEVTRVFVSDTVRRQGLGARLLSAVEERAVADGVTSMRLDVRSDLVEARALYARHGYQEVAAFNDSPYAGHWFRKSLR